MLHARTLEPTQNSTRQKRYAFNRAEVRDILVDRTLRQSQFPSDHSPTQPVEVFESLIL